MSIQSSDEILNHLKELGFNGYESKVYFSLLKCSPATGYEVSKECGVPQARVYDTLKVLESKQVAIATGEKPVKYLPVPPEELVGQCEQKFKTSCDYLKENLPHVSEDVVEPIINIRGENAIFKRIRELVNSAKDEIYIEVWQKDLKKFKDVLERANSTGIKVKVVGYNNVDIDVDLVYQHDLADSIEESLGGRWCVIAIDGKEGIIATFPNDDKTSYAVVTKNSGIVLIIKEMIIHDIFIQDIKDNLSDELVKKYGENLVALREKIFGKDLKFNHFAKTT